MPKVMKWKNSKQQKGRALKINSGKLKRDQKITNDLTPQQR